MSLVPVSRSVWNYPYSASLSLEFSGLSSGFVNGRQVPGQAHQIEARFASPFQAKQADENEVIADWLIRLTTALRNWGFGLYFLYLRNTKDFKWNHKRVYRIYRKVELNLRIKPKKRLVRERPDPLDTAT